MRRIGVFLFISAVPTLLISAAWIVSIGMFNWMEAVRSEVAFMFTIFSTLFAFLITCSMSKYEICEFYKSF